MFERFNVLLDQRFILHRSCPLSKFVVKGLSLSYHVCPFKKKGTFMSTIEEDKSLMVFHSALNSLLSDTCLFSRGHTGASTEHLVPPTGLH